MLLTLKCSLSLMVLISYQLLVSGRPQVQEAKIKDPDYGPPQPYEYEYKVEDPPTNTYYGKNENGDITGKVSGQYYVWLPDGRLMKVEYIADSNGFIPKISYTHNANPINSPNPFTPTFKQQITKSETLKI